MRVGIDFISLAILVAAFAVAQVRALPAPARFGVVAAGFGAVALYRT